MIQSRWVFQQIAMTIHKLYKPDDSHSHHQTPKQPSSKIFVRRLERFRFTHKSPRTNMRTDIITIDGRLKCGRRKFCSAAILRAFIEIFSHY